jgi:hypothetical protein
MTVFGPMHVVSEPPDVGGEVVPCSAPQRTAGIAGFE